MQKSQFWPLFDLKITTPQLELRWPTTEELTKLAVLARRIQSANEPQFQMSWMYQPSPQMERDLLQSFWKALGTWKPDDWQLKLAVFKDSEPIGLQDMWAKKFATNHTVTTGSWLGLAHQGQGYGAEMRAATLELAFAHLDAIEAYSDYIDTNEKSAAVSRKLGYQPNGQRAETVDGIATFKHFLRLTRENWEHQRQPGVEVTSLPPCLEFFGL